MNNKTIRLLIAEEFSHAVEKHPSIRSRHEGYAVLLEEMEETITEIDRLAWIRKLLWDRVKTDHPRCLSELLGDMKNQVEKGIHELAQVAAVCEKWSAAEKCRYGKEKG